MTGTSIAQAIPIAISPILTRIYTPEDFGIFAFYFSIVLILAVFSTARYELAIVLPKRREHAYQIVMLSWIISTVVSIVVLILVWFFEAKIVALLNNPELSNWLYWVPLSIFLTGIYKSLYYWFNRESRYRCMANSRIVQSSAMATSQVGFGFLSNFAALGLVFGHVIGQVFSTFYMGKAFIQDTHSIHRSNKLKQIVLAKRYINFPKFLLIANLMNVSSSQLPSVFFNVAFSASTAGFYLLVQRVIGLPTSIIGGAIGDVFRQHASSAYATRGECVVEYKATFKKLFFISIFPFSLFIFIAPDVFAFIFGENWRVAGEYAQLLTPMFLLQFIASPLSAMFIIAEKQKMYLYWQSLLLIMVIGSFVVGYIFNNVIFAIALFSASSALMYFISGLFSFHFSKGVSQQ